MRNMQPAIIGYDQPPSVNEVLIFSFFQVQTQAYNYRFHDFHLSVETIVESWFRTCPYKICFETNIISILFQVN